MLKYLYQTLRFFRNAFSRNITWLMFCMVVLGFIGASEMIGVTNIPDSLVKLFTAPDHAPAKGDVDYRIMLFPVPVIMEPEV